MELQMAAVSTTEEAAKQLQAAQKDLRESKQEVANAQESKDMALAVADEEVCSYLALWSPLPDRQMP
jgi:hypothetical protein